LRTQEGSKKKFVLIINKSFGISLGLTEKLKEFIDATAKHKMALTADTFYSFSLNLIMDGVSPPKIGLEYFDPALPLKTKKGRIST